MAPWLSLVECSTDNRVVPSSNLGGAIFYFYKKMDDLPNNKFSNTNSDYLALKLSKFFEEIKQEYEHPTIYKSSRKEGYTVSILDYVIYVGKKDIVLVKK